MLYEKYDKHWKSLLWIPLILLVISIGVIGYNIATTGSFMKKDIELTGGKSITFEITDADIATIKAELPFASVRQTTGIVKNIIVEIPFEQDENAVIDVVSSHSTVQGEPTLRTIGPSIGNIFFEQAVTAFILAFVFMAITVFVLFRSLVPSSIVVLAATTDIVVTIAILSILDATLSLPVIAALLTLIGYSVDTDLLLTSELLKGSHSEISGGVKRAMKTGLTLTTTTLVALFAMYFIAGSIVIEQIAFVLIIGLMIDIPATWLTNTGVLRVWLERRQK